MLTGPGRGAGRLAGAGRLTGAARLAAAAGTCAAAGLVAVASVAPASAESSPPGLAAQVRSAEEPVIAALGLRAAWRVSRGRGVTVAVLDTGVDPQAPDLTGVVTTGPDYTRGADPPGYQPPRLHGTFIASIIAGHGSGPGRAGGVIGVAPQARILAVRVILDDGEPGFGVYNSNPRYTNAIAQGIRYAVGHGAGVINMSLGSTSENRDIRAAVAYAISRGVVVVAAAGNSGSAGGGYTPYSYPASYTGVIAVAALGAQSRRAYFSDRNSSVVLGAPGVSIVGDAPGGQYLQGSGTSPASAFVAGVAALIRARYPRLSPALVRQALISSARHRPPAGYSTDTGFGEVDAPAALAAAGRLAARRPAPGLAASSRAAPGPVPPIQVVHRDAARIAAYSAVGAAGALAFLAALVAIAVLGRRARSARRDAGPAAPAMWLPGGVPPGPVQPGSVQPGPVQPAGWPPGAAVPGPGEAGGHGLP